MIRFWWTCNDCSAMAPSLSDEHSPDGWFSYYELVLCPRCLAADANLSAVVTDWATHWTAIDLEAPEAAEQLALALGWE